MREEREGFLHPYVNKPRTFCWISDSSGKRPIAAFEYTTSPFTVTSNLPPPDGTSRNDSTRLPISVNNSAAVQTALNT